MTWVHDLLVSYQVIFHPFNVIIASCLTIVYWEWMTQERAVRTLARWLSVGAGVVVVSLAPIFGLLAVTPLSPIELSNKGVWYVDLIAVSCLLIAYGLLRYLSMRGQVGFQLQQLATALAVAAVPYGLLSLVWDVSGHVTFTVIPVVCLTSLDRRFWALLPIPVLMVVNRPLVGVHTWMEAVVGFAIGSLVVWQLRRRRSPRVGSPRRVRRVGADD